MILRFSASAVSSHGPTFVGRADLVEDVHDRLVGAAVQRPLERADRADDRRVQVGHRARDHAGGEGRRVEGVLGVQDHRHVEGVRDDRVGHVAERHPEEVLRVVEVFARVDDAQPVAAALVVGDHRRQLREQAPRLREVRLARSCRTRRIRMPRPARPRCGSRPSGARPAAPGRSPAGRCHRGVRFARSSATSAASSTSVGSSPYQSR